MFSSQSKRIQVVARGPVFVNATESGTRQRYMLLKRKAAGSKRPVYLIVLQSLAGRDSATVELIHWAKTKHFTRAVRMFCDCLLEQAWNDDSQSDNNARALRSYLPVAV